MKCPKCKGSTRVVWSRPESDTEIRRRRECLACSHRFTTIEKPKEPK